ncbi:SDR family NAD(P)-dependent oxidoreductase [Streptomyces sp. NPDC051569]|uniref:SDR family NAD(P)-dependent oxidoreductase n=1 Tax=Streptomyces sp. NPDC051569 TaxID=3365661 RepID=UPI00379CDCB0
MGKLDGRTALVTGSTSGIGRAIATRLAAEGAYVLVSGRDADRGHAVVSAIRDAGGRADFAAADLTTARDAQALAGAALDLADGRVDILVNNAGIYPGTPTLDLDEATYEQVMDVNVRGPLFLTQALLPSMLDRGSGVIINMGSWVAQVGFIGGALYSASKAMLEQLTRGWASEFGSRGVRVNAIAPGVILSDPTAPGADFKHRMVEASPAGHAGSVEDIAHAAVYLAGDESAYVHGTTLVVDGGVLATRPGPRLG